MRLDKMADESDDNQSIISKDSPRIVIIGAGISGVKAAVTLLKNGIEDIVILEATSRTGGRIKSVELETDPTGVKAELGANWIHGIDRNPIYRFCVRNNMLTPSYQGRQLGRKAMFLLENGHPVNIKVIEEVDMTYGMIMSQVEEFYQCHLPTPVENDSVGAFVDREFDYRFGRYEGNDFHIRKMILQQRLIGECIIAGCHSMHDISLSEVGCFEELPGLHYVIPPGFESVVDMLKKDIPKDKILLDHPVTQITWNSGANLNVANDNTNHYEACIECQNGKRFYADHVIVTCSLGYLKKHHKRMFNPQLPNYKQDAIERVNIGTVNKVVLEFEKRILPEDVLRLELVWDRENIENEDLRTSWVKKIGAFEVVNEKGNVLIGWLSGREAEYYETLSDEEVIRACVSALKQFLKHQDIDVPKIKRVIRSYWKTNPYTLGSYSFIPVGAHAEDIESLGEPVMDHTDRPVLLFAGEATHTTFYSSSHGALLSGEREAQRIIDLYSH